MWLAYVVTVWQLRDEDQVQRRSIKAAFFYRHNKLNWYGSICTHKWQLLVFKRLLERAYLGCSQQFTASPDSQRHWVLGYKVVRNLRKRAHLWQIRPLSVSWFSHGAHGRLPLTSPCDWPSTQDQHDDKCAVLRQTRQVVWRSSTLQKQASAGNSRSFSNHLDHKCFFFECKSIEQTSWRADVWTSECKWGLGVWSKQHDPSEWPFTAHFDGSLAPEGKHLHGGQAQQPVYLHRKAIHRQFQRQERPARQIWQRDAAMMHAATRRIIALYHL